VCGRCLGLAGTEELQSLTDGHVEDIGNVPATQRVLENRRLEPATLALLAGGLDGLHDAQLGVDDTGTVARGTGALGVRAEQGRLHAVGLGERLADRVEQAGVRGRVAAPRAPDPALVDHHDAVAARDGTVDQRALARARDTGDHAEHAERDVDIHVLEVVCRRATDLQGAGRLPHGLLE
jgi:hypothetical protein